MNKTTIGLIGAFWGIGGFALLLILAIYRLANITLQIGFDELLWYHWLVLIANLVFMAYSEGYRGFQQSYAPRVAARAHYLSRHPTLLRVLLAPLFCMGFFHAPRRRIVSAFVLTLGIIVLLLIFQRLPQPWRGLLDAGVVLGLAWGMIATVVFCLQAFIAGDFKHSPEVPS